ncbi:MAG: hypothetical protein ACFFCV_03520 [Promethearchaeota archaeon]
MDSNDDMKSFWQHLIRKYSSVIIIGFFFLGMMNSLIAYGFTPPLHKARVSNIDTQQTIYAGEEIEIKIEGVRDCCAYIFSQGVYYNLKDREVVIIIWEAQQSCLCVPTPEDYNTVVNVVFLFSGNWVIRCNNFSISVFAY